ncbi:MAG: PQQ-binding-like beta-propeller repeat protein [Planctomycetota bacterium]
MITMSRTIFLVVLVALTLLPCRSEEKPVAQKSENTPVAPAVLPGSGLAQHDFLYAGEGKERKVFIVRKGAIVWTYDDPEGKGEISDATLLLNGNVLIAHQYAVKLIAPDKKVLWNYDAPKGAEIHTAQAIGKDHVLLVQNSDPPLVKVIHVASGEIKKQFALPAGNPKSVHGQFRHARITAEGTLMVAHHDWTKVSEYDADGKEVWSTPAKGPWAAQALKNGNVLIVESSGFREVNRKGDSVWTLSRTDVPDYKLTNLQLAWRLPNGNTLFNVWVNSWQKQPDPANLPVQALEVTPDKKVVWALRSWTPPTNLGPATTIQILDEPEVLENVHFGDFK